MERYSICIKRRNLRRPPSREGGRHSILVVKQENSSLGSPCKCPGLMVGGQMFGAHKLKASVLYDKDIYIDSGRRRKGLQFEPLL